MRLRIEMSIPVALDVEVEPDGEDDFTITHAKLSPFQDITVRRVNESMDDYTVDYILEKIKKAMSEDGQ
jgi:hypothetical protein